MDLVLNDSIHIIFIGGTGRSGTNITKKVLSKHPDVATLPFEYRFTLDPGGIFEFYSCIKNIWSPYIVQKKIRDLSCLLRQIGKRKYIKYFLGTLLYKLNFTGKIITSPPYFDWELEKWFPNYFFHVNTLLNDLIDFEYFGTWPGESAFKIKNKMFFVSSDKDKVKVILRKFMINLIKDLLQFKKKLIFVEDNTWNVLFIKEIREILPEAKFIHVLRDPRDVVVSLKNQRWAPKKLDSAIRYYSEIIDKITANVQEIENKNIYTFKLEELIQNPRKEIYSLCEFCNISFIEELIEIDLSRSNTGRWRSELNLEEQILIQNKLQKYLNSFNYNR